jgi:hypothetical protein
MDSSCCLQALQNPLAGSSGGMRKMLELPHLWLGMPARHRAGKEKVGYHHEHARQSQAHAQATGRPLDLDNRVGLLAESICLT